VNAIISRGLPIQCVKGDADKSEKFFDKFTRVREQLEKVLIENKDFVVTILQKNMSIKRTDVYATLLEAIIKNIDGQESVSSGRHTGAADF
jgi:hypothetical protein